MRSKSVKIVSGGCLGRGPLSGAKKIEKVSLPNPLRRVHSLAIAQVSVFPSGPKKSPKW